MKTVIGKCLKCKRLKNKPGSQPFAPSLADRITMASPFKVADVDFASPLCIITEGKKEK